MAGVKVVDEKQVEILNNLAKSIALNTTELLKLIDAGNKLIDTNNKIGTSTESNKTKQEKLSAVEKEAQRITTATEKEKAKLANIQTQESKNLARLTAERQKANKSIKDELKLEGAQENSKLKLQKRNKELRTEISKLDLTQEDNIETIKKYNDEIDANTTLINENSDATLQAKGNIGNYQESIEAALSSSDKFSGGTTNVISNFVEISQQEGGIKGFFQTFVGGIGSATKAGLKFILTPIGAVIAAIVVGIGLFTAAISRNESASDGFQKAWAGISNVIDELIGRFFKLVTAFAKFNTLDFKGAANDLSDAFTGLGDAIAQANKEGQKLFDLQVKLKESTITSTTEIAKQNAEAEKQNAIADDATRSFAERESAAEKARIAESKSAKLRVDLAKQQSNILDTQVKQAMRQGTINRALRQQQADANAELIEAEGELTTTILNNSKTRSELRQDRLERDLDILIDGFDNQKTINERLIADDRKTLDEKAKILEETSRLADESFAKQIETIEKFTDVNVNANELIATSDAVALNEKIRSLGLSEIIEGRLLEIIRERRIATQDLNEAEVELAKKRNKELEDLSNASVDLEKDRNKKLLISQDKFEKDSLDGLKKSSEAKIKAAQDEAQARIELQKMIKDQSVDLAAQAANAVTDILFEASAQKRDEELDRLDEEREEDLERAQTEADEDQAALDFKIENGLISESAAAAEQKRINADLAAEQDRINEEVDRKEAALKTKQAKADKAASLISVAISTAQGIAAALTNPLTAPAVIPFIVATGAIQAAAIAATPIPKFEKGTDGKYNTPNTWIGGERGSEMVVSPTGEMFLTPDKPTLFEGMANHMVIPHKETQQKLADMAIGGNNSFFNDRGIRDDLKKLIKVNKSKSSTTSKDGKTYTKRGNRIVKKHESLLKSMAK